MNCGEKMAVLVRPAAARRRGRGRVVRACWGIFVGGRVASRRGENAVEALVLIMLWSIDEFTHWSDDKDRLWILDSRLESTP